MTHPEFGEDHEGRPVMRHPLHWSLTVRMEVEDVGNGPRARRQWCPQGLPYVESEDGEPVPVVDDVLRVHAARYLRRLYEAVSDQEVSE